MTSLSKSAFLFLSIAAMLFCACSGEQQQEAPGASAETANTVDTAESSPPPAPPVAQKQYVSDPLSKMIYEIDLSENKITNRFPADDNLRVMQYDVGKDLIYLGLDGPNAGLKVFDPTSNETLETFEFPKPVSDMLFHPIKHYLFIVSEDSTNFMAFNCDSMKIEQDFAIHVVDRGFVGPMRIEPGPIGKVITANGDRASLTQIFTESRYMAQTVTIKDAKRIDYAVFALDGNASYSVDTEQGKLFKVRFGTGDLLGTKEGLDKPRFLQLDVNSNTVIMVVGETTVLMLHPDTFAEMGRVDLSDNGNRILSLEIPPRANFAEVITEYKGVSRWIRFDIKNWGITRLVELI